MLESIREQGIRNPIILVQLQGLHARYGNSRLWAARQLQLPEIPAIVVDFENKWADLPKLVTAEDVAGVFSEPPGEIVFGDDDFYYYGLPTSD